MPKVGTKHFPYTEEGLAMAREEAELVGEPIVYETDTARMVGEDMVIILKWLLVNVIEDKDQPEE